jgi:hypothetical protein
MTVIAHRKGTTMTACRYLRRQEASKYLAAVWGICRSPNTLAKLAVIGGGPIFRRAGRVPLYSAEDLDNWVASRLSPPMRSTSDVASRTPVMDHRQEASFPAKHDDDHARFQANVGA